MVESVTSAGEEIAKSVLAALRPEHPCIHCGADSNTNHALTCPDAGLYDRHGNPIPAVPGSHRPGEGAPPPRGDHVSTAREVAADAIDNSENDDVWILPYAEKLRIADDILAALREHWLSEEMLRATTSTVWGSAYLNATGTASRVIAALFEETTRSPSSAGNPARWGPIDRDLDDSDLDTGD